MDNHSQKMLKSSKYKRILLVSLFMNILFLIFIVIYFFTPYLDDFVSSKDFKFFSQKNELIQSRDEACERAEYLRWHGLPDADIKPFLISEDIDENIMYYRKNLELIPTGVDAQGGDVLEADRETFINEFNLALQKAEPIYDDYIEASNMCKNLTEEYLLKYGND